MSTDDKRVMEDRGIVWQMRQVFRQHRSKDWKKERIFKLLTTFANGDYKR